MSRNKPNNFMPQINQNQNNNNINAQQQELLQITQRRLELSIQKANALAERNQLIDKIETEKFKINKDSYNKMFDPNTSIEEKLKILNTCNQKDDEIDAQYAPELQALQQKIDQATADYDDFMAQHIFD